MSMHRVPSLAGFHSRWRFGVLCAELLRAVAWTVIVLLILGVFDFYAGFTDPARRIAFGALVAVAGVGVLRALWKVFFFRRADAAARADRALGSDRREILSALELASAKAAPDRPLAEWLRARAIAQAGERMRKVRLARSLPWRSLGWAVCWIVLAALGVGAGMRLAPQASQVIARRLLQPREDIPPYTPLHFTLGPKLAEVIYGGEILINAEITGGELTASVRCLTRDPATGRVDDSPAFQESATRYSRKLEKMAAPVEVAFAVGRARSAWMPVDVRMQPKVQSVLLTVQPPAYSGLPKRAFAVGSQNLAALPGSRVTALVTSNRPLSGGLLRIEGAGSATQDVAAEASEAHEARFTWVLRGPARLSLTVNDVAGTASVPLQLEQKITPDERPSVALRQPAGEVLATPDSELPLEADARDDLGLTRVSLVRKLVGFRERATAETIRQGERRHEFGGTVKLAPFGVQPGQVIELTLEAGDTNPNLLGVSVSDPVRIRIIGHADYAAMLRKQTTLEEFSARYESMQDALDKARQALEEMKKAAATGDAAAAESARQKARDAHESAGKRFDEIARDFPIFDVDEPLSEAAVEVARNLLENLLALDELKGAPPKAMTDLMPALQERLGKSQERIEPELDKGHLAIEAGKVFAAAADFQQIVRDQRKIVKDLNRMVEQIRRGETQAGQGLHDLGERQGALAEQLRQWPKDLTKVLDGLPKEFVKIQEAAREFIEALEHQNIPEIMDGAAKAGKEADSRLAASQAEVSLKMLENLLKQKNAMAQMCNGEGEAELFADNGDLASTLNALMRALIPRPGEEGENEGDGAGAGSGGAGGFSGQSDSGFTMGGKLPRLPVFGPPRSRPGGKDRGGPELGKGGGGKGGSVRPDDQATTGNSDVARANLREGAGEAGAPESVPERYRAAVKRYFSSEPAGSAPAQKDPP